MQEPPHAVKTDRGDETAARAFPGEAGAGSPSGTEGPRKRNATEQRPGAFGRFGEKREYSKLRAVAAGLARLALDGIYPPTCLGCDAAIADPHGLCARCWRELRPITAPLCPVLGVPFVVAMGERALSAEAIAAPPPFDRARAAVIYTERARAVVGRLKYGDRPEIAQLCARLMAAAGRELFADAPVLVPVPLHRLRQWQRRYNQSSELAMALGRLVGLEVDPLLVRRHRRTRQQVGLSAEQRARNVAGAFTVSPGAAMRLAGRGVLIVDDVVTTGATVGAVARAFRRAGVRKIDVISFASVVFGAD